MMLLPQVLSRSTLSLDAYVTGDIQIKKAKIKYNFALILTLIKSRGNTGFLFMG